MACFDALFRRYQRPIFNYVYRMIGRQSAAEDLTQDVFLRVFSSLERSGEIVNFRAWLYKVASNVAISQLRKHDQATESLEDRLEKNVATEPVDDERHGPEAQQLLRETVDQVAAALRRVPETQRQALVLRQLQGLSYQELAEVMGLSVEAVTSLLHRARLDFRNRFEELSRESTASQKGKGRS